MEDGNINVSKKNVIKPIILYVIDNVIRLELIETAIKKCDYSIRVFSSKQLRVISKEQDV